MRLSPVILRPERVRCSASGPDFVLNKMPKTIKEGENLTPPLPPIAEILPVRALLMLPAVSPVIYQYRIMGFATHILITAR